MRRFGCCFDTPKIDSVIQGFHQFSYVDNLVVELPHKSSVLRTYFSFILVLLLSFREVHSHYYSHDVFVKKVKMVIRTLLMEWGDYPKGLPVTVWCRDEYLNYFCQKTAERSVAELTSSSDKDDRAHRRITHIVMWRARILSVLYDSSSLSPVYDMLHTREVIQWILISIDNTRVTSPS